MIPKIICDKIIRHPRGAFYGTYGKEYRSMGILDLILTGVALSMDAFAVSIGKGLSVPSLRPRHSLIVGAYFGGFQALMPLLGFLLAGTFADYIRDFDHWIAFALLVLIGANMVREALSGDEEKTDASFGVKTMLPLALATSIDALAVGITFACVPVELFAGSQLLNTVCAVLIIGATTFAISCAGVKFGGIFGAKFESRAEIAGGVILILIGVKILLEYFGVL